MRLLQTCAFVSNVSILRSKPNETVCHIKMLFLEQTRTVNNLVLEINNVFTVQVKNSLIWLWQVLCIHQSDETSNRTENKLTVSDKRSWNHAQISFASKKYDCLIFSYFNATFIEFFSLHVTEKVTAYTSSTIHKHNEHQGHKDLSNLHTWQLDTKSLPFDQWFLFKGQRWTIFSQFFKKFFLAITYWIINCIHWIK